MRHTFRVLLVSLTLLILLLGGRVGRAADGDNNQPVPRQTTITISYTRYKWWLIRWSDNEILCTVYAAQPGLPTADEILGACGQATYQIWATTPPCDTASPDCIGAYLHLVSSEPAQKNILVDLPKPQVWISLKDCPQQTEANLCTKIPVLLLTGEEPLPNQQIIAIHGLINNQSFNCVGSTCEVPLQSTPLNGVAMEFWADSSFGDSSEHFTALVRVVDTGVSPSPVGAGWYVDVISSQWKGKPLASCAQIWDAFPPIGEPPAWLTTPEVPELLASEEPYRYLAGRLIAQGTVNASSCPGGGLLANGYADECGLEKARPVVNSWQNQFDSDILAVAGKTGVPAQLLKNVFAQESQFWPGAFKDPKEFGLGQITDNGAETILLWNPTFFYRFCPLVLDAENCDRGYVYLDEEAQATLRGALAAEVRADCSTCPNGLNLNNMTTAIELFANTLLANCSQMSRIVFNATGRSPGSVSDYENLWRYTVANYHVGPGCTSYAIYNAWIRRDVMDWAHVSSYLTPVCQPAIPYVEKVTK